jgi:hypothetical protein
MPRSKGSKNAPKTNILDEAVQVEPVKNVESGDDTQPFAEQSGIGKKAKNRISVQLTEDGKLDTESMRAETLAKVRTFFQDPDNQKLLGATGNVKIDDVISEKDVAMLFDLIGTIEGWGFSFIGKIDADIAAKAAAWTEKEKEMVVAPAQRVIAKNAASLTVFMRWKDEIVLGVIFLAISRAKFENARKEQKARNDYRRANGGAVDVNPADFRPMTETPQ